MSGDCPPPETRFQPVLRQQRFSGRFPAVARVESSFLRQERAFQQSTVVFLALRPQLRGESRRSRSSQSPIRAAFVRGKQGGGRPAIQSPAGKPPRRVRCCRCPPAADEPSRGAAAGTGCPSRVPRLVALEGQRVPPRTDSVLRCTLVLQRACGCELFSPADDVPRFVDMKVHMSLSSF